uniref:Uncharacterized protein n=2 Tax=Oryza TaxID=4527 RepID=A0A0D3HDR1_9ORYZ
MAAAWCNYRRSRKRSMMTTRTPLPHAPAVLGDEAGKRVRDPMTRKKMSGGRCDRGGEDRVASSLRSLNHRRSSPQSPPPPSLPKEE